MQRRTRENETATAVGRVPRVMTVAAVLLAGSTGGAFQVYYGGMVRSCVARSTRLLSSRAALADRVPSPQEYATGTGARPAVDGAKPGHNEAESLSFFERMGRPRYIAAPMVEQSEAGEV